METPKSPHPLWTDHCWVLLMQLYMHKPTGTKALYSRRMVELSLELHIPPQILYAQQLLLRRRETPFLQRLWNRYAHNPHQLSRAAKTVRRMQGYGNEHAFYQGVETNETFEPLFRPIPSRPELRPITLIVVLDLYFRLTPITMVEQTPEVVQLSRQLQLKPCVIVEVLRLFQSCDPWLRRQPPHRLSRPAGRCGKTMATATPSTCPRLPHSSWPFGTKNKYYCQIIHILFVYKNKSTYFCNN